MGFVLEEVQELMEKGGWGGGGGMVGVETAGSGVGKSIVAERYGVWGSWWFCLPV